MKVKDLIEQEVDIDVYDDVTEELGIAFCGAVELSPDAQEHFAEALDLEVKLRGDECGWLAIVCIDDDDEKVWKRRLKIAKELFESLAGYCSASDYEKWFKEC